MNLELVHGNPLGVLKVKVFILEDYQGILGNCP